ncbi:MAG: AzlC family ABC transporter permease [Coriobacteriia bacterium]
MPLMPSQPSASAHEPQLAPEPARERVARFVRGLKLGFPIFLGYVPVGAAFGILACGAGFSVFQAALCSATALAGAGQFIALALLVAGAPVESVLIATTVVNLRYVLFGSTLSPYLKGMPLRTQALLAYTLTDETFAINIADRRQGLSTAASMAGVGAVAWCGWVLGTLVGAIGTGWIGDPSRFGVGFAMPAMFTALFIALAENRRHVLIGFLAMGLVLALPLLASVGIELTSSWTLIAASMIAATVGSVIWRED